MSSITPPQGSQRRDAGNAADALGDAGRRTQDTAGKAAAEVRNAAADIGAQGKEIAEDVRRTAQDAADSVRREAQSLAETAAKDAHDVAEQGKGRMAAQMATVGAAIGKAAEDLDHHGQSMLAAYARRLGDGVQDASHTVHEKQVEELIGMVGDFARRQPAAFIGGAALLGFVASRFAKSSAQHVHGSDERTQPLAGRPSISEPWPIAANGPGRPAAGKGDAISPVQPSEGGL